MARKLHNTSAPLGPGMKGSRIAGVAIACFALLSGTALGQAVTAVTVEVDGMTLPAWDLNVNQVALDPAKILTVLNHPTVQTIPARATVRIVAANPAGKDLGIVLYRYDKKRTALARCFAASLAQSLTLDLRTLNCNTGNFLDNGLEHGGVLVANIDGASGKAVPLVIINEPMGTVMGSDFGVSLNVLDRSGDEEGARYSEGVSAYYSIANLKTDRLRIIANLTALDFDDEIDLETGIGVGLLFRFQPADRTNERTFTISFVRGYNLMTDDDGDGWYNLIGFGWSFGRTD